MQIRTKVLVIFLTLSLLPLAVIGAISYQHGQRTIRERLGATFQQIAYETMAKIDLSMYEVNKNVHTWAELDLMQEVLTGDLDGKISVFLIGLAKEYGLFSSINALNREGEIVASSNPALVGQDATQDACYLGIGGNSYVGDVHLGPDESWVVTFAFPIQAKFQAGLTIGMLCADWKTDELISLTQSVKEIEHLKNTRLMLMRRDGLLILAPGFQHAGIYGPNLLELGLRSATRGSQGESGSAVERDAQGTTSLIGYHRSTGHREFSGLNWIALVAEDTRSAFAPIHQLRGLVLGLGAIVTLIVVGISLFLARRMTRPILDIAHVAGRVAQGDFEGRVNYPQGDELGLLATAFNRMTQDLKQQRAQLVDRAYVDNIIKSMRDMLIVMDPQAKILTVNHAACTLLGYKSEELIGQPIMKIFPAQGVPLHDQTVNGGHEQWSMTPAERLCRAQDGRDIPVYLSSAVMRNPDGDIQGIVCVAQDMSERKRAEQALKHSMAELARSNAELQQFAYVASHDLQEPLRMVASYTQLLGRRYRGKLDSTADEFIAFAVDGVVRMQKLLDGLLEYARVGTRSKPFEVADAQSIFNSAVSNLRIALKEAEAVITHDRLPNVLADPMQLSQLFQNLIGNAIKFHRKDAPPRIHVSAERWDRTWLFSVRDNGIGIDPKHTNRIFAIFQKLHNSEEYPGTGIGLAICKKVVERHGGRIWVESEADKGATFFFTVPIVQMHDESQAPQTA